MSKEVTLVFGKDENDKYLQYPLGNTLVLGKYRSNNTLSNIIDAIVLRYTASDVQLMVYTVGPFGMVAEEHPDGVRKLDMCKFAENSRTYSFVELLLELLNRIQISQFIEEPAKLPTIVVLENVDVIYRTLSQKNKDGLDYVMRRCRECNIYLIMSMQDTSQLKYHVTRWFDHTVCSLVDIDTSYAVFKSSEAADLPKHGKIMVKSRSDCGRCLNLPYYNREKKKAIVSREILPHGVCFDIEYLKQYATLNWL